MPALAGDQDSAMKQNQHWTACLVKAASDDRFWGTAYLIAYFAPVEAGARLLAAIESRDSRVVREICQSAQPALLRAIINEASQNLDEPMYEENPVWAETNFIRLHLGLGILGYQGVDRSLANQIIRVSEHARTFTRDHGIEAKAQWTIGYLHPLVKRGMG